MMQPTTTSSRWGAVSSIALLCTPSSCVRLVNCEVSSIAKDVVLLKSAALGGPPTKWATCSCACPSVAPFFRTGRTLHDCSSFLARGKCTWRRRTALQEVCENRVKKKKKNTPATGSAAGSRKKTTTAGRQTTERVLFIAEGLCIGLAAVSHTAAVIHSSTTKPVVVEAPLSANKLSISTWQVLPLWGAILLNVILRARQWQVPSKRGTGVASDSNRGLSDFTSMIKRVQQLEEDVQNTVTTSRVLSRHLEKLGVRFRMAVVTQKTSEVVSALAQRQDVLEIELQELQQVLLAMQEQQAKQLALISAGIGKMLKGQQKFEERVAKELSGKQIKGEGEALGHVAIYDNHPANGAPQKLSKSVTRNSNQFSDQSLSKVDFWAEPVVQPVTLPSLGHKDQPSASFSKASDEQPQNLTGLGTFFRSRKQFNGNQGSRFRDNHRSISDEGVEGHSIQ
ncbi:hypothetical protein CY35_16G044200 [Sphagnum magellanicum]|nr:hypothetical protein CY35_16G044200 [Sphagnum magellanicum]